MATCGEASHHTSLFSTGGEGSMVVALLLAVLVVGLPTRSLAKIALSNPQECCQSRAPWGAAIDWTKLYRRDADYVIDSSYEPYEYTMNVCGELLYQDEPCGGGCAHLSAGSAIPTQPASRAWGCWAGGIRA